DLRELGCEQEHGCARIGELSQEPIDLMLGADIDASRRIKAKQGLEAGRDPSCNDHLLLIAAAQAPQLGAGAGVNLQALHGGVDALPLATPSNEAPIPWVADERQRDTLADRLVWAGGRKPIRRPQHKARRDRVARMVE